VLWQSNGPDLAFHVHRPWGRDHKGPIEAGLILGEDWPMTTNRMVLLIGLAAMLMIAASAHLVTRYFPANVSADAREQFGTESC
jgi:hypothetical protein